MSEKEVFIRSSTIIPRLTSPPSSPTRVVLARTPTAMIRISNSTVAPLFIVALFPLNSVAVSPSINLIPFSSRRACISAAHSSSRMLESTLVARSQTVIDPTRPEIPSAHLSPIRPAPTINTLLSLVSTFSSERVSFKVIKENLFCTVSSPLIGGIKGAEPVATQTEV